MTPEEQWPDHYAQGARCGHIEGRGRAGSYVQGEEHDLSAEAADNQHGLTTDQWYAWSRGYRKGYVLAAEGCDLPPEFANAKLP